MKSWMDLHDFEAEHCPHCDFELAWYRAPAWAVYKAVFALDGKTYRIESVGSSNREHYPHFAASVYACELCEVPVANISESLQDLFALVSIDGRDLLRALHVAPAGEGAP